VNDAEMPGWEYVPNENMPDGRGTAGMCSHPDFGILIFGGELTEQIFTSETWLLPSPGGTWQQLMYASGNAPSERSNPGLARYGPVAAFSLVGSRHPRAMRCTATRGFGRPRRVGRSCIQWTRRLRASTTH